MGNEIRKETKASIGLDNVDNTSDANKPVSTAQQTALDLKLDLVGGILSDDLEFSGTAALEIADNKYVFKSKSDNDAGIIYNSTDVSLDNMSTAGVANSRVYLETGITRLGGVILSSDFTKTADITYSDVPDLELVLLAGKKYKFKVILFTTSDVTGGIETKLSNLDTLTATNIIYEVTYSDVATNAYIFVRQRTVLDATGGQAGSVEGIVNMQGSIEVNVAGTMGVKFAQQVANGSSKVLRGSTLTVEEIA